MFNNIGQHKFAKADKVIKKYSIIKIPVTPTLPGQGI